MSQSLQLLSSADIIVSNARSIGLNVSYQRVTAGDGNCWYHAVIDQLTRPEIAPLVAPHFLTYDHVLLRLQVVAFIRQEQNSNETLLLFKRHVFNDNEQDWLNMLSAQETNGTFATGLFCLFTSILLNVKIDITTSTSTRQHPSYALNESASSGAILLIGNLNNIHFQSLIHINDDINFQISQIESNQALGRPKAKVVKEQKDYQKKYYKENAKKILLKRKQQYNKSDNIKSKNKRLKNNKKVDTKIIEQENMEINNDENEILDSSEEPFSNIHTNPSVINAMKEFESGEENHSFSTCKCCFQTRPVFYSSAQNKDDTLVKMNNFVNYSKKSICSNCMNDNNKRRKKSVKSAAKFSGHLSPEEDLGPINDSIRHNNMHFLQCPPQLKNLSSIELALVSKITVAINVHMLRYGMLASKGHSVSLPQGMAIAKKLPQLPENVGIIVLQRKGKNDKLKQYTVSRLAVEEALKCLCFGVPCGGLEMEASDAKLYTGPNHINTPLNGRYFYTFS